MSRSIEHLVTAQTCHQLHQRAEDRFGANGSKPVTKGKIEPTSERRKLVTSAPFVEPVGALIRRIVRAGPGGPDQVRQQLDAMKEEHLRIF